MKTLEQKKREENFIRRVKEAHLLSRCAFYIQKIAINVDYWLLWQLNNNFENFVKNYESHFVILTRPEVGFSGVYIEN